MNYMGVDTEVLIKNSDRLDLEAWHDLSKETVVSRANLGMAAYFWAEQNLTPNGITRLRTTYARSQTNPYHSLELPPEDGHFTPLSPINKELLVLSQRGQLQFKDVDGKTYQIPVSLSVDPTGKDKLGNPTRSLTLWLDEDRLVKGRARSVELGSRKLRVPIEVLARVVKVFELIGDGHFDSLPKIAHEPGDVAVGWSNLRSPMSGKIPFSLSPYILIVRDSTNLEQTSKTLAQALALTTNNMITLSIK